MFLYRLKLSEFDSAENDVPDSSECWKVYAICSEDNESSQLILQKLVDLEETDAFHVVNGLKKLLRKARIGKPLETVYDKKQCHDAFNFKFDRKEVVVWRIWPGGDIRIYFCYGNNRHIVVSWALAKRRDNLSTAEKTALEEIFTQFLDAQKSNQIRYVSKKP